ncbi:MAG: hypothetical protein COA58_02990 [Bacteroidetes bacterium]|nr:MAG: hypothetical protein COA58_02990 [Bacteroidota bacterium]
MYKSLKVIKQELDNILDNLSWDTNPIDEKRQLFEINNLKSIRTAINNLISLNLFEELASKVKKSAIFTTADDSIIIQRKESIEIDEDLDSIETLCENFTIVLASNIPEENINSINIKLPEVNDFDELAKVSREIHLALTQVIVNDEINGQTKIESVENGSIWLNVLVGTSTAVTAISSLAWSAAVINKKRQEGKLLEQQVRSLNVKNDSLQDILKAQKEETKLMISAEAEYIDSEHFKEKSPENIERIKSSIKTFADLINQGAEIHPALIAPENVSNLFPDPTKWISLESKIKKLPSPDIN